MDYYKMPNQRQDSNLEETLLAGYNQLSQLWRRKPGGRWQWGSSLQPWGLFGAQHELRTWQLAASIVVTLLVCLNYRGRLDDFVFDVSQEHKAQNLTPQLVVGFDGAHRGVCARHL